jgi:hypothetical protein
MAYIGQGAHIHPAPTNIINSVKGWNTRHVYNYYGSTDTTDFNYADITKYAYTDNLFTTIENYDSEVDYSVYKGGYTFPPSYFRAGKDLRIKSFLYVSTDTYNDARLQLNVGINNSKTTYVRIGASNKGIFHDFGEGSRRSAYLETEIVCRGIESLRKPPFLEMIASGYIRYNIIESTNNQNYLIPIVPTSNTFAIVDTDVSSNVAVENTLNINFSGSSHIPIINVLNLSIEELE